MRQIFNQNATKRILDPRHRLKQHSVTTDNAKFLTTIKFSETQMRRLQAHMVMCDFEDVNTIVAPVNVQHSARIEDRTYDVIEDHAHLTPQLVANSIVWNKLWAAPQHKLENLELVFSFFESNADPSLWEKCIEQCNEFDELERGGPLMIFLALDRIQRRTEDVLKHVQAMFKTIRIKDIPGENIDEITTLTKTTHKLLAGASSDARKHLPDNFSEQLLDVLQTSSVRAFNLVFSDLKRDCKTQAALHRREADYPTMHQLTALAESTYLDLIQQNKWVKTPPRERPSGFAALPSSSGRSPGKKNPRGWKCILCGSEYHLWRQCPVVPKPTGQQLTDGRAKWGNDKMRLPKRHRDPDGKPRIQNKRGYYVLDTKEWRAMTATSSTPADTASEPTPPDDTPPSSPSANLAVDMDPELDSPPSLSTSPPVEVSPQPDGSVSMRAHVLRTLLGHQT